MEIAGIVIGGVGLAALFETCMKCFGYIDTGRKYGKAYQRFVISMCSLQLRMSRWWYLSAKIRVPESTAIHIIDLLGEIQSDLEDAQTRAHKHKPTLTDDGSVLLETLASRFQRQAKIRQQRTSFGRVVAWALNDQKKCKRLIEDIENAIKELEIASAPDPQLTHRAAVEDAQQLVQPSEVEEPAEANAAPVVEILRDATEYDRVLQQVLEIVAKQASSGDEIRNIFTSDRARVELDDFVASGYTGPTPAERQQKRTVQDVVTSGDGRLRVGKTYGGKGVFDD